MTPRVLRNLLFDDYLSIVFYFSFQDDPRDAAMTDYKTYAYGVLSSGGVQKIYEMKDDVKTV